MFSFVGTGKNTAFTTFNNGGQELFDERVTGPGFSFAGAVQTPQSPTSVAGSAFINGGCDRRPSTLQLVLRPLLGSDAELTAPLSRKIGNSVTIEVIDGDRNRRTAFIDTVTVTVRNLRTGELETLVLNETGPNTGIFRASLPTLDGARGPNNNGLMSARTGDILETLYTDVTNSGGASRDLTRQTRLTATDNPAQLLVTKRSVTTATGADFAVPGNERRLHDRNHEHWRRTGRYELSGRRRYHAGFDGVSDCGFRRIGRHRFADRRQAWLQRADVRCNTRPPVRKWNDRAR